MCNSKKVAIFADVFEIAKHLEILLLSNDCVTIPEFGGFVAHYLASRMDEADGTFLPPMRTIGFNPQLKMNDSLLVQSYVEAYDISYPEALRRIEQEVEQIKRQIMYEGFCTLEGIGTLTSNDEGSFLFDPQESGVLTPSLYGLNSFEFAMLKPLSAANAKTEITTVVQEQEKEEEEKETLQTPLLDIIEEEEEHAIQIKMSWIRNTVAIAAAIVLFFLMTTPVENSRFSSQTMSALQHSIIQKLIPQDTNILPPVPVVTSKKEYVTKQPVAPVDTIKHITSLEEKPYCLVLASQVKRSNAEQFTRMLQEKGFKDTEVYVYKNVVRVVYGHFKSESDAYIELHNLRFEENFEEAWVYKRKVEG